MTATQCPFDHSVSKKPLNGDEELLFPLHKRCIVQYSALESTGLELHIYYDDKEISFDEPAWFAFGETLAKQARFVARSATEWGDGYDWTQIQPLLEQLLTEGVLLRADQADPGDVVKRNALRPSPLPAAQTDRAHSWRDCLSVTRALTGRDLELGYLEEVVPIFRIAHIALDAEGRQVGEANVFPAALRLDVETEWRTCPYSGSRYLDERPMNVTALRSMSNYWPQMMGALRLIRAAYLQRYPDVEQHWTVGSIEALATLVLAVPTYQLMRNDQPVTNGELHPALASMFRVTDGLRMVTHQMIFVPVGEPTLPTSAPMTVTELYDYSERNYAFSSVHGVCAGPRVMVEEFMNVLINGHEFDGLHALQLEDAVQDALNDLPAAFDYGLLGLQVHVVSFSIWPAMTECYVQLQQITQGWQQGCSEAMQAWKQRLQQQVEVLNSRSHHANQQWRQNRQQAYADIYQHCAFGLGDPNPISLFELLAPVFTKSHQTVKDQLLEQLIRFCDQERAQAEALLDCLMVFLMRGQAILQVVGGIQQRINRLLGRKEPELPFELSQMDIHNLLQGVDTPRFPFLLTELNRLLNIEVTVTAELITINTEK